MYTAFTTFLRNRTLLLGTSIVVSLLLVITPILVNAADSTAVCSTWYSYITTSACWLGDIFAYIGASLVSFGALLLYLAGTFLDNVVYYGIVDFGNQYNIIKSGVEQVWTLIRDFANIGIIGAFVFVAISTILNVDAYNIKNFVVKLLIAATLINFSLFFTKTAFDVSNLTATVFANAIGATHATGDVSISANGGTATGFAGAFIQALGLSGTFDVTVIKQMGRAADSAWVGLITGILMFIFLALTAIVFLYASFLLIARVVTVIFLLLVSAGAFAAYAIPTLGGYWNEWKTQLMRSALFAPLLMMFLWAVMVVTQRLSPARSENLSAIIMQIASNDGGSVSIHILFNFAVIIGLLIVAIKSADKFAVYAAPKLVSGFAMKSGNYIVGKAKGIPKGAWNTWDYYSSKSADQRVRNKDWQPNTMQKAWASTRSLLWGDPALKGKIEKKMAENKRDRLLRKQEGDIGFGKTFVDLKEKAEFAKRVFDKGISDGGYKKVREEGEKSTAKLEDKRIKAEATETSTDQQTRFYRELNKKIGEALDDNTIGHNIAQEIKTAFKDAQQQQAASAEKIREHEAALANETDTKQRQRLQEQINVEKQREQNALRNMQAHRDTIMQDKAMREKFNAQAIQDINKKAQQGHSFEKDVDQIITEKYAGDPWKMQAVRARFGKAKKEESAKDNIANLPDSIAKLIETLEQKQPQGGTQPPKKDKTS